MQNPPAVVVPQQQHATVVPGTTGSVVSNVSEAIESTSATEGTVTACVLSAALTGLVFVGSMTAVLAPHLQGFPPAALLLGLVFVALSALSLVPHVLAASELGRARGVPRAFMWGTSVVLVGLFAAAALPGSDGARLALVVGAGTAVAMPCFGEVVAHALRQEH